MTRLKEAVIASRESLSGKFKTHSSNRKKLYRKLANAVGDFDTQNMYRNDIGHCNLKGVSTLLIMRGGDRDARLHHSIANLSPSRSFTFLLKDFTCFQNKRQVKISTTATLTSTLVKDASGVTCPTNSEATTAVAVVGPSTLGWERAPLPYQTSFRLASLPLSRTQDGRRCASTTSQ